MTAFYLVTLSWYLLCPKKTLTVMNRQKLELFMIIYIRSPVHLSNGIHLPGVYGKTKRTRMFLDPWLDGHNKSRHVRKANI